MRNGKGQFVKGSRPSIKTEFKKGSVPFNKGLKQSEWLSQEAIEKTKATRFKKGQLPKSAEPLGYVSCCAHKRKGQIVGYDWYINIDWQGNRHSHYNYRKYLWETFYGEESPKGMVFIAKNGNQKEKPTIGNIEMITRVDLIKLNNPKL